MKKAASKRIHIFLCPPRMRIQQISIVPTRKVNCLQQLFNEEKKFIFNGMLLDQEQTFSFYNIIEGSHIILLPKIKEETSKNIIESQYWIHITDESDNFLDKINSSKNGVTEKEAARLKDMKYIRKEGKSREYPKLYNNFENLSSLSSQNNDELNIEFEPLLTPSMEPLPPLWMTQPHQAPPRCMNAQSDSNGNQWDNIENQQ